MTVEIDEYRWFKSSYSVGNNDGQCVEVAFIESTGPAVGVRDTKNRDQGHFEVNPASWGAFLDRVKSGELDL